MNECQKRGCPLPYRLAKICTKCGRVICEYTGSRGRDWLEDQETIRMLRIKLEKAEGSKRDSEKTKEKEK